LLLAIASLLPGIAWSGQGVWSSGGPYGGDIRALAIDPGNPSVLYAGVYGGGVYKSTDGGLHWMAANTGLTNPNAKVLVVDPRVPSRVYVGVDGGVFGSTNSGRTWRRLSSQYLSIESLAADPTSTSVLYAGTWTGVFKSTDAGATWVQASEGLTGFPVEALAFDPTTTATFYAGTLAGVFKSSDGGGHWAPIGTGLPQDPGVFALAIDRVSPTTLYAGLNAWGVFKSTDGGMTWAEANAGIPGPGIPGGNRNVFTLAIDPVAHDTIYAGTYGQGLYKSTDAGAHWAFLEMNTGTLTPLVHAVLVTLSSGVVFAGTETGVFRSNDSGGTWAASSVGLAARTVNAIAVAPTTPAVVYAGTDVGVFRSADGGGTWVSASTGMVTAFQDSPSVWALAVDPSAPATVYAGPSSGGVFKSLDSGASWKAVNHGLPDLQNRRVTAFAIDPRTPTTVYISLVGGISDGGVFKSIDAGANWSPAGSGLGNRAVISLAIDSATPSILYAGTDSGLFRSSDSAGTWVASDAFPKDFVRTVAIDPTAPSTLYAGVGFSFLKSEDSGVTWAPIFEDGPFDLVQSIVADPTRAGRIYAGTFFGTAAAPAVFRSDDSTTSWQAANVGLPFSGVMSLAVDRSNGTVYAGLWGGGVWKSVVPRATGFLLPSSARIGGAGGSFYTTDLTIANVGEGWAAGLTLTFLGHDREPPAPPKRKFFYLSGGTSMTLADILGATFGQTEGYGAIEVTSESPSLKLYSRTSTPGFGGTFGQSLAPVDFNDLIPVEGTLRSLLGIREGDGFRTNLALASEETIATVMVAILVSASGETLAVKTYEVPPRGMIQINRVVRDMGVSGPITGARLALSAATGRALWTAFASVIDETTNDATAIVPQPSMASGSSPFSWLLPSSVHAAGLGGASYSTNLTVANVGGAPTSFTLAFLGHDVDGSSGPEATFDLAPGRSVTYADVLGSVFGEPSTYGAIRIRSESPFLNVVSVTSTHRFGGTFGQSIAAVPAALLIPPDSPRTLVAIREGAGFRSNLILASLAAFPTKVDTTLFAEDGAALATKTYTIPPNGMTQINRVALDMGASPPLTGARLQVSSTTPGAAFAAVASVIDETTYDPAAIEAR
jgi:hypothetical protein